jgi:hypothetical protein
MILALAARGKKIFASLMLAVVYLEIILPLNLFGAPLPVYAHYKPESMLSRNVALVVPSKGRIVPMNLAPATANERNKNVSPSTARSLKEEHPDVGGPTQPEMQAFHAAGNVDMVDLFTGDLTYNIPLLDVGGYPITIGYNSGVSMDQEASWVGLGWNINPGTVSRNLRGIPDDFNGKDSITKEITINENKTVGGTVGAGVEIAGNVTGALGQKLGLSVSMGVFKNTYRGWGMESGISASLSATSKTRGALTAGLSITNNSQEAITVSPTFSYQYARKDASENGGYAGSLSIGTSYNSRGGLRGLQLASGISLYKKGNIPDKQNKGGMVSTTASTARNDGAGISFAFPGYTPTINIPYTNEMTSVAFKLGAEFYAFYGNVFVSGYVSKQYIAPKDKVLSLPAYGYLNFQSGAANESALLDFNREKEIVFREKPAVPNIAVPSYTYDVFSISGEGTGGNFRAYRNDIGYVFDHEMTTRDKSLSLGGEVGVGALAHIGLDITSIKSSTRSAAWKNDNPLADVVAFRNSNKAFEAAYFRNPSEMTINSTSFYDAIGGDNVVTPRLFQQSKTSSIITTTNKLTPYKNGSPQKDIDLNTINVVKPAREKRTQVITYLTAREASEVGLSKYIENYGLNKYPIKKGTVKFNSEYTGAGDGLAATYFSDKNFIEPAFNRIIPNINFPDNSSFNNGRQAGQVELNENFSGIYTGKLRIPQSGVYYFQFEKDDGYQFYLNDEYIIGMDYQQSETSVVKVNIEGGKEYNIRVKYFNAGRDAKLIMSWQSAALGPNPNYEIIPGNKFYLKKDVDSFVVNETSYEKRINAFRKADHISEIDVLNADGRRYVYGIPVYNVKQKEATFSVNKGDANIADGLVTYAPGVDDGLNNMKGRDRYYGGEILPAYAHSYLLTGILSPDYTDLTSNGITDDDPGNAIRFNYTKTAGIANPFLWKSPYNEKATYNEGLKTDDRDDKGSYVSGAKELWYLNSVESKNMIAVFRLGTRNDLLQIDVQGKKSDGGAKRLEQIDLYSKADFLKDSARAKPVKSVHFDYTYELCPGVNDMNGTSNPNGKLTLQKIWFSYNGNEKGRKNAYKFNYNKLNPAYSSKKYDGWGNYKDFAQNPGGITNSDYPYPVQDSTVAATNAAAWALDSVLLPAGGRIKINYESDDYAYVQNKRAMSMCSIAGLSGAKPVSLQDVTNELYGGIPARDYMYVAINVPYAVKSNAEVFSRYLDGIEKLYFRLSVKMPTDKFGSGNEYVPCYARLDAAAGYGFFNNGKTIWVKLKGIDKGGNDGGSISPLLKVAAQFLKLNLPSKAYPGSDNGDSFNAGDAVKVLVSQASNIMNSILTFEETAKAVGWVRNIDLTRSVVRLNNPYFKKYGGGHRVKSVIYFDSWNKMTGQRESRYGKEYTYTTTKVINKDTLVISSGVAAYEPVIGGEENPWHLPIEYLEQVSVLAPIDIGYTEEPLGEGFFPSPSVGYSKVRVRTINAKKARSANGYEETCFFTTKDFPTITERTPINEDTRKRFKNPLADLLKINSRHFLAVSQGFKVELNDMNGRLKSQATYGESDPDNWIAYTENFYRVENPRAPVMRLSNKALTISPKGIIDTSLIGKDVELMLDMREERSLTNTVGISPNADIFAAGIWPFALITLFKIPQREEVVFRSVAATKVINRHGILDSVVVIDKGSKVVTNNLLFDAETGAAVLTSVQNEFNDSVFNFTYPAAWIYEGMSGAYKNVGVVMDHIDIREGRITAGLQGNVNDYFFSGDELLVFAKRKVAGTDCAPEIARWPVSFKVWAVDANILKGGVPDIYFVNEDGSSLTGNDISLKITRSGRKNIGAMAGSVTMLKNPVVPKPGGGYSFILNNASKVVNASVTEYRESWKVPDRKKRGIIIDTFRNDALSRTYAARCGTDGPIQNITITIPKDTFKSVIDLRDANRMAADYLDHNGQYLANKQVKCVYFYSKADSGYFRKNNCEPGAVGELIFYRQKARTDSSVASQVAADNLAKARMNIDGVTNANSLGRCMYYNTPQSGTFTRNNCPNGGAGVPILYTLPAKTDSSYISVDDANNKTRVKVNTNGQTWANANGACVVYAKLTQVSGPPVITRQNINADLQVTTTTKGDVIIRFYSDAACTIPANVTNLTFTLNLVTNVRNWTPDPDNVVTTSTPSSETITVSGTSKVLKSQTLLTLDVEYYRRSPEIEYDPYYADYTDYQYSLAPNAAYIIKY